MGLKLTYSDTITGEVLRETVLDDEDVRAFKFIADDPVEWMDNAFKHRIKLAINEVCTEAIGNNDKVILNETDKNDISSKVGLVTNVNSMPENRKKEIVKKAAYKTARERTIDSLRRKVD